MFYRRLTSACSWHCSPSYRCSCCVIRRVHCSWKHRALASAPWTPALLRAQLKRKVVRRHRNWPRSDRDHRSPAPIRETIGRHCISGGCVRITSGNVGVKLRTRARMLLGSNAPFSLSPGTVFRYGSWRQCISQVYTPLSRAGAAWVCRTQPSRPPSPTAQMCSGSAICGTPSFITGPSTAPLSWTC
jgi:hypothetical protein